MVSAIGVGHPLMSRQRDVRIQCRNGVIDLSSGDNDTRLGENVPLNVARVDGDSFVFPERVVDVALPSRFAQRVYR